MTGTVLWASPPCVMSERTATSLINYEQPLNERMRFFLRYEQLSDRFVFFARQERPYDAHGALLTLIEIYNLISRGDIKQELLKQIKQQIDALELLAHRPKVNTAKLNSILAEHKAVYDELHAVHGKIHAHLENNDFISSIRHRVSIPGGICNFDIPEYHHWLRQPFAQRKQALMDWIEPFQVVGKGIAKSLQLIRQSVPFSQRLAMKGFYRQSLDPGIPCQMIRIRVGRAYFPECSTGKQRFSIHFMTQSSLDETPWQTDSDIKFKLACCGL